MRRMKMSTYEMDLMITEKYYQNDQTKMGLSLVYDQQGMDQLRNFKQQQKQLMNYLHILFGGDTKSHEFQSMSKNLIKKLTRQKTDDSMARDRAR